jgi:hypothetical protein
MSTKGKLWFLMAMAMSINETPRRREMREGDAKKIAPPPSGTKEYFFNASGEFSNSHMRRDECIFKCYALNDKSAIKKFNKSLK